MKWFEYIIIIISIGLVLLPIILSIVNKKKGKSSCSSDCCCCNNKENCYKNFKLYMKKYNEKKKA